MLQRFFIDTRLGPRLVRIDIVRGHCDNCHDHRPMRSWSCLWSLPQLGLRACPHSSACATQTLCMFRSDLLYWKESAACPRSDRRRNPDIRQTDRGGNPKRVARTCAFVPYGSTRKRCGIEVPKSVGPYAECRARASLGVTRSCVCGVRCASISAENVDASCHGATLTKYKSSWLPRSVERHQPTTSRQET